MQTLIKRKLAWLLISEKVDFRKWKVARDKARCHTTTKGSVYHEDIAIAKSRQSCPTLCNPIDGSPPGFPSLGFSRQEHWSGLPFPSPMHESVKWKWIRSVVSNSVRPHRQQPTRLLCPWDSPGKNTGVCCHFLLLVNNQHFTIMRKVQKGVENSYIFF